MPADLQCESCKKVFHALRATARYCPECRASRAYSRHYELHKKDTCPDCGQPMVRRAEYCLRCSNRRRGEKRRGEKNGNWKLGQSHTKEGYVLIRVRQGNGGAAYAREHILVWERTYGKPLPKGWVVHHLNGVKDDNRPINLLGLPMQEHHSHPREVLKHYEVRIRQLEQELQECRQLRLPD